MLKVILMMGRDHLKRSRAGETDDEDISELHHLVRLPEDALDTDDEQTDQTFSMEFEFDTTHMKECFCEEWLAQLDRDNFVSLGLFYHSNLQVYYRKKKLKQQN